MGEMLNDRESQCCVPAAAFNVLYSLGLESQGCNVLYSPGYMVNVLYSPGYIVNDFNNGKHY